MIRTLYLIFVLTAGLNVHVLGQNMTRNVIAPQPAHQVVKRFELTQSKTKVNVRNNTNTLNANHQQADSIIMAISKQERTLSFIDPVQIKEIARIPIPGGPHELTTSPDGRFAYLANYYQSDKTPGHSISVIDIAARKEIKKFELGGLLMLHGIVESDGKLYFTSEQTRSVARYNLATGSVDWIRGTGQSLTHILVVSHDGSRLYATNMRSDTVTAIDIEGSGQDPASIKQIPVGKAPEGIAISPDGKELWVGHNGDGSISIIDTTTLTVKKTFKVGMVPIRLKYTSDGNRVIVVDPRASELIIYDAVKAQEIKRVKIPGGPVSFAFSPDEKQVVVSLLNVGKAAVVDLESGNILGFVQIGLVPDGIAWVKTPK